jgi:D-alanyl-D-alanine endopeptidase (penicillin-binding protein 7)
MTLTKIFNFTITLSILIFISGQLILPAAAATTTPYDELGMASVAINSRTGKLVAEKNQNLVLPLASLTKLMTAQVLLSIGLNLNKTVTITESEVNYTTPYISAGDITSKIDLRVGDKVKVKDLWHAMLIASSNEAAIALVDHSGLSRAQFVKRMNSRAKALGLKYTKFTEPTGIDPKNLSTAKEMAVIARRAFAYVSVRQTSVLPSYKFKDLISGRTIGVDSRNNSLLAMKPLGMKVGYLTEAKINVAVRLQKAGKDLVVVVLHALNNARRNLEINRLLKI